MMMSASEQIEDMRMMARSGWIGRLATVFAILGVMALVTGVACIVFGYVSSEQTLYGVDGVERPEHERHEGSGPVWNAGIGLLVTSGVIMGLSVMMCVCLCLYQSNTGARKMVQQKSGLVRDRRPYLTPTTSPPAMRELSLSSNI